MNLTNEEIDLLTQLLETKIETSDDSEEIKKCKDLLAKIGV